MVFGWQGFRLALPEGSSPIALSGSHEEGYARLVGNAGDKIQIRWLKTTSEAQVEATVQKYLDRIQRDARKRGGTVNPSLLKQGYRLVGSQTAWGAWRTCSRRSFILEVEATTSAKAILREAANTLAEDAETWLWAVNGLHLTVPSALRLSKSHFLAGRTQLDFKLPGLRGMVFGHRWAFAEKLLAGCSAGDWAKAMLGWKRASLDEASEGTTLRQGRRVALVRHDAHNDRLIVVAGNSISKEWQPQWDWIAWDN